jgi:uncharacterized membrane protein (UPF0127 family)
METKRLRVDGMVKFFNLNREHTKNIVVEIAETSEEQSVGLMNRDQLTYDQGMFFIFNKPGIQLMWMKNVNFPLDMIFIDTRQLILNIEANTEPRTSTLYESKGLCKYVVEVLGGFCEKFKVDKGQKIEFIRNTSNK